MHTMIGRLRQAFPFLGERAATEEDLFGFAASEGVPVEWSRVVDRGLYSLAKYDDVLFHVIALNTDLAGVSLRYVLAHELGHYLFHVPSQVRNGERLAFGFDCKDHHEAETVAALLLLPIPELEAALLAGTFKENDDLAALIHVRVEAWGNYGE